MAMILIHIAALAVFALLLALTRNLLGNSKMPPVELRGKTLVVLGLGGSGEQIARQRRRQKTARGCVPAGARCRQALRRCRSALPSRSCQAGRAR